MKSQRSKRDSLDPQNQLELQPELLIPATSPVGMAKPMNTETSSRNGRLHPPSSPEGLVGETKVQVKKMIEDAIATCYGNKRADRPYRLLITGSERTAKTTARDFLICALGAFNSEIVDGANISLQTLLSWEQAFGKKNQLLGSVVVKVVDNFDVVPGEVKNRLPFFFDSMPTHWVFIAEQGRWMWRDKSLWEYFHKVWLFRPDTCALRDFIRLKTGLPDAIVDQIIRDASGDTERALVLADAEVERRMRSAKATLINGGTQS